MEPQLVRVIPGESRRSNFYGGVSEKGESKGEEEEEEEKKLVE